MDEIVREKLKAWGCLLGCFALILIFMFVIAPLMEGLPFIKPIVQYNKEQDIDAGALYYTEVEQFSVAEVNMNNTMKYMPNKLDSAHP
jgi:hypothetical protein